MPLAMFDNSPVRGRQPLIGLATWRFCRQKWGIAATIEFRPKPAKFGPGFAIR